MVVGDIATGTELLVIGGGPGGYSAAIRAAKKGMDVTLVERDKVGGTCLNYGCIPAKSLIHAAGFQKSIEHWDSLGIHTEELDVNFHEIQDWKINVIEKLNSGVKTVLEQENVDVKKGEARFIDGKTVRVGEAHKAEKIEFEKCIIATGSRPIEIPGLEFDKEGVISSKELLYLEEVPEDLVVVGGGYIGMEAVTKFCKFGSNVKIIESESRVLANFEEEIVDNIQESSSCYTAELYTSTNAVEVKEGDRPVLVAEKDGESLEIEGDYVLVAAGRTPKPVLENLQIKNADLESNEDGFIEHDNQMKASEDIFVIGDAAGTPMLAHKAYMEGKIAAEVASGENSGMDSEFIPKVMYTDPEVAVVGLNEDEARKEYGNVLIGKFSMAHSGRALTTYGGKGFVKVVASEDEKLLGVSIVSERASEMIAEATLALEMQAYLDDVIYTVHAHPTFAEGFKEACEDAKDLSVHS